MDLQRNRSEQQDRRQRERELLEYPYDAPEAGGSLVALVEGVFWIRLSMPMSLDHINVYLLDDGDGWYIVDTGLNIEATHLAWQKIAKEYLQGKPVKGIICTHFHYDHSGAARWLIEYFNAPLYMSHGEFYTMQAFSKGGRTLGTDSQKTFFHQGGLTDELINEMFRLCSLDPYISDAPDSFVRLREGDCLRIGSREWEVIIGEGHSPEHVCLYNEKEALLIAGDQLLPSISSNVLVTDIEPRANPLKNWFSSLEKSKDLKKETLALPSHGFVFRNVHLRADQLIKHHMRQLDTLKSKLQSYQAFTVVDAVHCLFAERRLSPVDMMLAHGEALAHLSFLHAEGVLRKEMDPQGVFQYAYIQ
jgi:glyoxylase-like metal-dependent hydrolase (beta-lactamase superfamily II)